MGLERIELPSSGLKARRNTNFCYNPIMLSTMTLEIPDTTKTFKVVLYGGEDPDILEIKASRYSTDDKDDWIVFYDEANEPVAEFPRYNIQGLYVES